MAKIQRPSSYVSVSKSELGGNSEVFASGDLVSIVGGVAVKASSTSGRIAGISNEAKTFDSDNQTVAQEKLSYSDASRFVTARLVNDATLVYTDEDKYFKINDSTQTVDVATKTTDALNSQVRLVKAVSPLLGDYQILTAHPVKDSVLPTLVSAAKDSVTQITVTLSEFAKLSTITKSNAGGFSVKETGAPSTAYAVSAIAPGASANLVVLTVADMTASASAGVTVTYAAGGNGTVADQNGNALATDATGVVIAGW